MPHSVKQSFGTIGIVLLVGTVLLVVGGATPAAASHDDLGNLTITLPEATDHQPGDQNPERATVRYFFQGTDAFTEAGAPDGLTLDSIIVESEVVDFSACGVGNIAAFGLDRGGNNSGTQIDKDLVQHLKTNDFRESGLYLRFYQEEDFGGDPVFMNPDDAIRAQQGSGSSDGPCYTMPEESGWYQMTGYLNGTTPEGEYADESTTSHYVWICDCEDESEAREKLGRPPSEEGDESTDTTPTPEPTATPQDTPTPEQTATPQDTPTPEQTRSEETATPEDTPTETAASGSSEDGGPGDDSSQGGQPGTPTPGEGAGFGAIAALLSVVGTALLARIRT